MADENHAVGCPKRSDTRMLPERATIGTEGTTGVEVTCPCGTPFVYDERQGGTYGVPPSARD